MTRRRRFSVGGMYGPGPAAPPNERMYLVGVGVGVRVRDRVCG